MRLALGITRDLGQRCYDFLKQRGVPILGVHTFGKHACDVEEPMSYEEIVAAKPDLFISIKYPKIIGRELLTSARCVNLHTAKLPEYRGCNGFYWAIVNNDLLYATTLTVMEEGIDTGAILAERFTEIRPDDTSYTLAKRVYDVSFDMFCEEIDGILSNTISSVPQRGKVAYYTKDIDRYVPHDADPLYFYNKVRALDHPDFPPAYTLRDGIKYELRFADVWNTLPIRIRK